MAYNNLTTFLSAAKYNITLHFIVHRGGTHEPNLNWKERRKRGKKRHIWFSQSMELSQCKLQIGALSLKITRSNHIIGISKQKDCAFNRPNSKVIPSLNICLSFRKTSETCKYRSHNKVMDTPNRFSFLQIRFFTQQTAHTKLNAPLILPILSSPWRYKNKRETF